MKIVFIGGRDIHKLGGIENYMYNLATQLVKLGHQPIVYCESDKNRVDFVNGFEVRYVKGPSNNLICKPLVGLKATLHTVFRDKDIDLIHYNAWPPSLWCWIPRIAGIPSLMEGHGLEWQRTKYSPLAKKILKFMEAFTVKINQHLIMCSEAQVRYFRETYNVESVCIPTAINIPDLHPDTDILDEFSLERGKYLLFMGRLVRDKNPDILIKAFNQSSPVGYKLVIAGDNDAMPQYVESLHNMARENHSVVFTGAVYGEDKETLLRNAFCFCLPSTIEGLSIALLEAMAYKLPIIASDIEANREVLGPKNALWVRPEDIDDLIRAINVLMANDESFYFAINANYELAIACYTWPNVASRYVEYIIRALE